jgi:glutathione S-transferase
MRLYVDAQFASPYAMSVFVALHEKHLPFDIVTVDLAASANHEPEFAGRSLTHRVPTLEHDDFSLSESSAITEYLEERFPGVPLYPSRVRDRARARQIQAWLRSDLMAIRQDRPTEVVFYGPVGKPLSAEAVAATKRLFAAVHTLLPEGALNLFGDWSIADVDLAMMLNRLIMNGDQVPSRIAAYAKHQWERPTVQLWQRHSRPQYRRWG